ncbi:hypothetical protein MCGE09_00187 [Thaumarchaeota archaeon SCGC AB-539-E09]|nr:hypothetical protein MCGE09_00187 [Thaumarchaeota archaeon SCGC AB-539-E09]
MKFIAFFEIDPESYAEAYEADTKRRTEGRYVKSLFPPHMIADTSKGLSGFVIFEADDVADVAQYVMEYTFGGKKNIRILPIWESQQGFEIYKNLK